MSDSLVTKVWDAVSERVGDDLRVVARYEPTGYEGRMRDDVRRRYDDGGKQAVVDDVIVSQMANRDSEAAYRAGRCRGFVRVFDEAWVLSWADPLSGKSGFLVSIQRDGATATMDDVEWCLGYLDEEVAPLAE